MGIPELLEAIARLAEKLIHEKLDSFIKEVNIVFVLLIIIYLLIELKS